MLGILSKKNGVSKAEIIRRSLEKFLNELPVEEDPAMGLIGLGGSKKGDLSVRHDQYITGYAKSKRK